MKVWAFEKIINALWLCTVQNGFDFPVLFNSIFEIFTKSNIKINFEFFPSIPCESSYPFKNRICILVQESRNNSCIHFSLSH